MELRLNQKTKIIGERVNPTGKERLAEAMRGFDVPYILSIVKAQMESGCEMVDINVGAAGVEEVKLQARLAKELSKMDVTPCFDSFNADALQSALENFDGRAVVNSASTANKEYERIIKLAAHHNAIIILLPYVHKANLTFEDRQEAVKELLDCAYAHGLAKDDILVDGVAMAVSSDVNAPQESVKFISWCTEQGLMTVIGLSNISFGLPNREAVNRGFLAQLVGAGLTTAIADPTDEIKETIDAGFLLSGKDEWCMGWIEGNR
jgi:5-methyltetrahydrofolate--homocysteine methyltransferase